MRLTNSLKIRFLFQIGAIKTTLLGGGCVKHSHKFLFQIGAIKTQGFLENAPQPRAFLFQIGAIKTVHYDLPLSVDLKQFLFQIGAIKTENLSAV